MGDYKTIGLKIIDYSLQDLSLSPVGVEHPDSVTESSVLSNPANAQNVSCLGLCGRDICPKGSA